MAKRQPLPRPLAVKEVLLGLMKPLGWEHLEQQSRIRQVWEQILPREVLAHTRLLEVRRRELWVEVNAPAWSTELQFLKPAILLALAKSLGPGAIRDVKIRIGTGKPQVRDEEGVGEIV
jgi:predicted nucleic acid-binding Zn ribbon protein